MKRGSSSAEAVQAIRERVDLVDLVSQYLTLQKRGQDYVGLCPFHSEKTPSFTVSPVKQLFYCFGCGAGGDIFGFLMRAESLTFPDAVRLLGEKAGVAVRAYAAEPEISSEKEPLFQVHQQAAEYFHRLLLEHPLAEPARRYLQKRGVDRESVKAFQLGYALPQWDGLLQHLGQKTWKPELLERAGLVTAREGKDGYYDRFRNRVIFPIRDLRHRVVAFGGRILETASDAGASPKYLNSPETEIYKKGQNLYGLDQARGGISSGGGLVVVEGYLDALTAHQAGLHQVVATLGTALTPDHVHLIRRFSRRVMLVFDPDQAGVRAALRTVDLFMNSGVEALVVRLPEGQDPDAFIRQEGSEAFRRLLSQAVRLLDFALERIVALVKDRGMEEKLRAVEEVLPVLSKVSSHVERSHYVKWVADRLEIRERDLVLDLAGYFRRAQRGKKTETLPENFLPSKGSSFPVEEETLIKLLLQGKIGAGFVQKRLPSPAFSDPRLERVFSAAMESLGSGGDFEMQRFWQAAEQDPELGALISSWTLQDLHCDDYEKTAQDCMQSILLKQMDRELRILEEKIRQSAEAADWEAVRCLQKSVNSLKQQMMAARREVALVKNFQEI